MSAANTPRSAARSIDATGSFSRTAGGQIVVEARHRAFVARALHPMARVGSTPVVGLRCSGGVLRGLVLGTPGPGDELVVRYPPEPELRTGIAFELRGPNVA